MNRDISKFLVLTALCTISTGQANIGQAASFDCAKAATLIERSICEDQELSYVDEKLNLIYRAALRKLSHSKELKLQQRKWLVERDSCQDSACIRRSYDSRIAELAIVVDPPRNKIDEIKVCTTVADYANRDELSKLHVEVDKNVFPIIHEQFPSAPHTISQINEYWVVDIDNDDIQDSVFIETSGTAHMASVAVKSSRYSNASVGINTDLARGEFDLTLIAVAGKYFVISQDEDTLVRMWHIAKGSISPLCSFKKRDSPQIQILNGGDNPVCRAVQARKANYIHFSPILVPINDYEELTGEAISDITNTGHPYKVYLVNKLIPGGRGCSWKEIMTEDEKNPDLLYDSNEKSSLSCNHEEALFVLNDKTYIEARTMITNWPLSVHMVKDKQNNEICLFESKPYYEAQIAD